MSVKLSEVIGVAKTYHQIRLFPLNFLYRYHQLTSYVSVEGIELSVLYFSPIPNDFL